jgi:ribosome-associated protein
MKTPPPAKGSDGGPDAATVIAVRAEPIELCQLLKFAGLTGSGGEAKQVISEGKVLLNGTVETQKRKKVMSGDRVTFGDETLLVKLG